MARTKMNQRSANRVDVPMGATGGRTPPSKVTVALLGICVIAVIWAAMMLMPAGRVAYYYLWAYSEYYMGVLTLVALSITIMVGLVATDRLVLSIRQRVLLQSAHRTTGVIAVASLFFHVWTKLMEHHIRLIDVFVPFLAPYNTLFIGLGTASGFVMVLVMWTGLARSRFIGKGRPWMWRSVHAISYLMWPLALVHGLSAGRAAAPWVTISYVVCVGFVLVGLAVRLTVSLNRRKDFSSTSTGSIKPVGSLVPTNAPSPKKRMSGRRRDADPISARVVADRGNAPAAAPSWVPAAPISAAPYDEEYQRGGRSGYAEPERAPRPRRYAEEEVPAPRQRRAEPVDRARYAEIEAAPPRSRRRAEEDQYDDESRTRARRVVEENRARSARAARYAEDDEPVAPRSRRAAPLYADQDEPAPRPRRRTEPEPPARSRRYPEDGRYEEAPRPRGGEARRSGAQPGEFRTGELRPGYDHTGEFRLDEEPVTPRSRRAAPRYAEDADPAPRARRDRTGSVDRADSGRHSRSEFVDLADPADAWGSAGGANYPPPDETPTLVDMASRRARRAAPQPEVAVRGGGSRGARRGRSRGDDDSGDEQYFRQLRGEAQ